MKKTTISNVTGVNRVNMLEGMRTEAIIDGNRFGDDRASLCLVRCGDLNESDAHFPTCALLQQRGYDVKTMALALECGAISVDQLGQLITNQSTNNVNTAVGAMIQRHNDCELDLGALSDAGYDGEKMAEALFADVLTKRQLWLLIYNQTQLDVDTAVSAMLDRAACYASN